MDPNLLKHIDYFAVPNNQAGNVGDENAASSSSAPPISTTAADPSLWDMTGLGGDVSVAEAFSSGPSGTSLFTQPSSLTPNLSFNPLPGPFPTFNQPKVSLPTRAPAQAGPSRRKDGHDRKRAKVNSESAALESVDYWIQFDDDDGDNKLGGSFEINFPNRKTESSSLKR
jgi:hypothetical protein